MPSIILNDRTVQASEGQSVLEAATEAGVTTAALCYHKDLSVEGSCRLCMVEVDGIAGQVAACATPVHEGKVIRTETLELAESRRFVLELLLGNYRSAEREDQDTEFMRWVRYYGAKASTDSSIARRYPVDSDPYPFIRVDLNQCILCTRCVRACEEVQGRFVWGVGHRGSDTKIIAGFDTTMPDAC